MSRRPDWRTHHRLLFVAGLAGAIIVHSTPTTALVVDPFFAGHGTLNSTSQLSDYNVSVGWEYNALCTFCSGSRITIDPAGLLSDGGGIYGSGIMVPDWSSFDFDVWAPLWNNQSTVVGPLGLGGQITYGNPAPGLFAVTWIDVVNGDDPTIRNTFQVLFVGPSTSFHTNAGFAISPGSVIFSYGGPTNPSGTVNLSATSPAAIGIWNFRSQLTTLNGMGIGDSNGVLSTADVAALQNSGDPFLFNFNSATGALDQPVAFASIPELVPEPATGWLLGVGVVGLIGLCRRPARAFDSP